MSANTELTITIITAEEGKSLLYGKDELYSNVKGYCDKKSLTNLKKELGIESRRIIKYVLTYNVEHPSFKCIQNKKITYKNGVFCDYNWPGAEPYEPPAKVVCGPGILATTKHPYGDILIVLENDPLELKKEKELKKMKKEIMDKLKTEKDEIKIKELLGKM